jgi:predicted metal-binding protein
MSIDTKELINEIMDLGASFAAMIDTSAIEHHEEYRKACEQNVCRRYNTTWSGPPAIGPISELIEKVKKFKQGVFIQNVFDLEDPFDYEGMVEGAKTHEQRFRQMLKHMKTKYRFNSILPLNAGCCNLCERCSYLDGEPCRYPEEAVSSVECYGIDVTALKKNIGIPIYSGKNTVAYVALILFEA